MYDEQSSLIEQINDKKYISITTNLKRENEIVLGISKRSPDTWFFLVTHVFTILYCVAETDDGRRSACGSQLRRSVIGLNYCSVVATAVVGSLTARGLARTYCVCVGYNDTTNEYTSRKHAIYIINYICIYGSAVPT